MRLIGKILLWLFLWPVLIPYYLLRWVFGRRKPRGERWAESGQWYQTEVTGESNYQANLERICGKRKADGENFETTATLVPEDGNRYDPHAVYVMIDGLKVGYLDRVDAPVYRQLLSKGKAKTTYPAIIRGGWKRGRDRGSYGVYLGLDMRKIAG